MSLDQIINVTVDRATRFPTQAGFGKSILLVCTDKMDGDLAKEYADADEMLDDGWDAEDDAAALRMATAIKSQEVIPPTFWVGRRQLYHTQIVHLIPRTTRSGYIHTWEVNGVPYSYTNGGSETVATICDGIVIAMAADAYVTVTDGTTHAICTADVTGTVHHYKVKKGLDLFDATTNPGLATDLAAIAAVLPKPDYYGLLLDCTSAAHCTALATYAEANVALGLVESADWSVRNSSESTDIASVMKTAAWKRTAGIYHQEIGAYAAPAWMGSLLPRNPGIATWADKTLSGVTANDLSSGECNAINNKYWTYYANEGGVNVTIESRTPYGEFIDLVQAIDFARARVQESIWGTLLNNQKVPQTDMGIEMVRMSALSAMQLCASSNFPIFDPATILVTAPKLVDIPVADRGNRILPGVVAQGRLTGAFHKVTVRLNVYV